MSTRIVLQTFHWDSKSLIIYVILRFLSPVSKLCSNSKKTCLLRQSWFLKLLGLGGDFKLAFKAISSFFFVSFFSSDFSSFIWEKVNKILNISIVSIKQDMWWDSCTSFALCIWRISKTSERIKHILKIYTLWNFIPSASLNFPSLVKLLNNIYIGISIFSFVFTRVARVGGETLSLVNGYIELPYLH